jgi:hypothetical protein
MIEKRWVRKRRMGRSEAPDSGWIGKKCDDGLIRSGEI